MAWYDIKGKLKVFRWDHLSHYQWSSWLSPLVGIMLSMIAMVRFGVQLHHAMLICGVATLVAAALFGYAGERSDAESNEVAVEEGGTPTHEVSKGDITATVLGGVPTALPMFALYLMHWHLTGKM